MFTFFILACTSPDPGGPVGPPVGAPVEAPPPTQLAAPPSDLVLADWEAELLSPILKDLRSGLSQHGDQPFGICRGATDCEEFLGPDPDLLEPGTYFIKADLAAPSVGEWSVNFRLECHTETTAGLRSDMPHERTHRVKYAGEGRAFKLQPLWKIQSPHTAGQRQCSFELRPVRPDGVEGESWSGTYRTPAP